MMRLTLLLILACCGMSLLKAQPCTSVRYRLPVDSAVTAFTRLSYGEAPRYSPTAGVGRVVALDFDFYEPHNDEAQRRPLVLIVPDAWDKGIDWAMWARRLARNGYACAVMRYRTGYSAGDYRSMVRADFRAAQDVDAALRFFWAEQQVYGLDGDHFFVLGVGSGAAAALQAVTTAPNERHPFTRGTDREPTDMGCRTCTGNPYPKPVHRVAGLVTLRGACIDLAVDNDLAGLRALLIDDGVSPWPSDVQRNLVGVYRSGRPMWQALARGGAVARRVLDTPTTLDSLLAAQWATIQSFLYLNLSFQTPMPAGPLIACAGEPTVYQLPNDGAQYADCCWLARGGTVVASDAGKATVAWDYGESEGTLVAVAANASGMSGLPSDTLVVQVRAVAKAAFALAQPAPNVISLTDASNAGSYFIVDFGDGSPPQSGSLGDRLVHTYDLLGRFLITQTLFNNCGTSVSNQYIDIAAVTSDAWQSLKAALPVPDTVVHVPRDTLVLPLYAQAVHNPVLRVIVKPVAEETRVYDAWVSVADTSAIQVPHAALKEGRYELWVSADANTVKQYFEVVKPPRLPKSGQ